jgi:hypothetical protein
LEKRYGRIDLDLIELLIKNQSSQSKNLLVGMSAREYQGGAVFWSPRKVKESRDRQQLQEREEEQVQHQKAEVNRLREDVRQVKAREKEKAEKATEQASRAAARRTHKRLKQALKISQSSKKCIFKVPAIATLKKSPVVRPAGSREPQGAAADAPAI